MGWEALNWVFDLGTRRLLSALFDEWGESIKVFSARTHPVVIAEVAVNWAGYRACRVRPTASIPPGRCCYA